MTVTLYNDDCLNVMRGMGEKSVNLCIADPPYNINKADWDNWKKQVDYIEFIGTVFLEIQRVLKDNGSFYWFHNDMTQVYKIMDWIDKNTNFVFKQFIVWNKRFDGCRNKGFLDGFIIPDGLRNYQQMSEYCLFYTFQDETGLNKIMNSCVDPIRNYIREEIIKCKGYISLKEINEYLGTATNGGGVASAVLSDKKSVPAMITEEHYLKLRDYCNGDYLRREYEDLRREYEDLRREYEDLRYTFNNQKTHHSVWNYEIAQANGHPTPKPVPMMENIILHSSNPGDIVLDPFTGSCPVGEACLITDRNFIGIEKDASYFAIAERRIKEAQQQPTLWSANGTD